MIPPSLPRAWRTACMLTLAATLATGMPQSKLERPSGYALTNVRLSAAADGPLKTLILQDGRIVEIRDGATPVPPGLRLVDGEGLIAYPAFIDAWSSAGCDTPSPVGEQDRPIAENTGVFVDMRDANRKGIQPAFRAVDVLDLSEEGKKYRKNGFGALLSAPNGELLAGHSALATTRDAARRDVIVRGEMFQHAAFRASGRGYPSTLMAYLAQFRQFFLDAQRHRVLKERYTQGRPGLRPAWDPEFEAAHALLDGSELLVCEANGARDIRRWIKLADEFGLRIAISGGREAWKVADLLFERKIPVFLSLDWGEEVEDPLAKKKEEEKKKAKEDETEPDDAEDAHEADTDADPSDTAEHDGADEASDDDEEEEDEEAAADENWKYAEPLAVRVERRRLWVEIRDCAQVLYNEGVTLTFCSGKSSTSDLMKSVRELVKSGFPADAALAALTSTPAELLGIERRMGYLQRGQQASLALWTAEPFAKDAQVVWLFTDGFAYEFEVDRKKDGEDGDSDGDLNGHWSIVQTDDEDSPPLLAHLHVDEDGVVTGTFEFTMPGMDEAIESEVSGTVKGSSVKLTSTFSVNDATVTLTMEGTLSGESFKGETKVVFPGGEDSGSFKGLRLPDAWFAGEDCCDAPRDKN